MATVIRLARYGAKKRPYYHIVVTDSRNARNSGNVLEVVGKYDPMQAKDSDKRVILKIDEVKAWLAKGAQPSDRVYKFLANAGLVAKKAIPVQTKKHLQSEKTQMKIKDKADKLAKIAEEKAAAAKAKAEEQAKKIAKRKEIDKAYNAKYRNKGLIHSFELSYGYQSGKENVIYKNLGYREYGSFHCHSIFKLVKSRNIFRKIKLLPPPFRGAITPKSLNFVYTENSTL